MPANRPAGRYAARPLVFTILAAAASLLTAWLTWRRSRTPGLRPLRVLCLCSAAWSLLQVLELSAREPSLRLVLGKLQYAGMVATPLSWLAFAIA